MAHRDPLKGERTLKLLRNPHGHDYLATVPDTADVPPGFVVIHKPRTPSEATRHARLSRMDATPRRPNGSLQLRLVF
jgi:hypothetical protein